MSAGGYHGFVLAYDLGEGSAERAPIAEEVLRAVVGGAGLGAWLLHGHAPAGVDPLAPSPHPASLTGRWLMVGTEDIIFNLGKRFLNNLLTTGPGNQRKVIFYLYVQGRSKFIQGQP